MIVILKRLLFLIALFGSLSTFADEAICIYTKDGSKETYFIQNKPKVIIAEIGLVIFTNEEAIVYPLGTFAKFTFEEVVQASIETIQTPVFDIKDNIISTNKSVKVYDVYGQIILDSTMGTIDFSTMPKGIYVVKTETASFKYYKK